MSFWITVPIDDLLASLQDSKAAVEAAARPAAQAGAQVLYDEVKSNVARIKRKSGRLSESIYQAYSRSESEKVPGRAVYHISWNQRKAPHGHLVEFGHLQRYVLYRDGQGHIRPLVRPGREGERPPTRSASQSVKDAYWIPLKGGPRQIPAKPFVRAARVKFQAAADAMRARFIEELAKKS